MADQSDGYKTIRQFINKKLQGKNWDALISALATGDDINYQNILALKDQLKIATASGPYLETLLGNLGVDKPPGVGLSDDLFRELGIKQTNSKLVTNILLDVLETFYGIDATHASVTSGVPEFYQLSSGMTLALLVDTNPTPLSITFSSNEFNSIGLATAAEVASAITTQSFLAGYTLYAESYKDSNTGLNYVKLYSNTRGPKSSITVIGGSAQNILQFPNMRPTTQVGGGSGIATEFSTSNVNGKIRFTWVGGADPALLNVNVGDYVNLFGNQFLPANQGYFNIVGISNTYFDIINPNYQDQGNVTITCIAGNSGGGIASRQVSISAGLTGLVRSADQVTVTTVSPHMLSVGDIVTIQNSDNSSFSGSFQVAEVPSSLTFIYNQNGTDISSGGGQVVSSYSIEAEGANGAVRDNVTGIVTINTITPNNFIAGQVVEIAGVEDSSFNGQFTILSANSSSFTYSQSSYTADIVFYQKYKSNLQRQTRYATVFEVNPYEVVIFLPATSAIVIRGLIGAWHLNSSSTQNLFLGSYTYDTKASFSTRSVSTRLTEEIGAGQVKTVLFAQDTTQFPDSQGYVVFDFGTSKQEGPVRYFSTPSGSSIQIDATYKFQQQHDVGSTMTLLYERGPYVPATDGSDYQPYLTDTIQGRIQAEDLINKIVALGITVNIVIVYPGSAGLADVTEVYNE